jgi:DNA-binding NarL/FixJ family response regulator
VSDARRRPDREDHDQQRGRDGLITVLVVDDHAGFLGALERLLRSTPDLVLVGSACGGEEGVSLAAQLRPRVVVMDLAMPGLSGVEATRRVRSQREPPTVVALSGSRELMRDAIAAGAAFTLLKEVDPAQLLTVIRAAAGRYSNRAGFR